MTYLYTLLIKPLELVFEFIFYNVDKHIHNPGISIITLSLAMNILVLPLYRRADRIRTEEREKEESLRDGLLHIRNTFHGNERFYILKTFYRQNGYSPLHSLKGSVPLLLEIPFFIAAYHFLSNLDSIKGVALGPVRDLGVPDALISFGSATVNVLPILMTVINITSGMVYSKKLSSRYRVQLVIIPVVFFLLLYNAPAGLVIYWTFNNVFSLFKNIYDLKAGKSVQKESDPKAQDSYVLIYHLASMFLFVFLGLLIPGGVIASSVSEFVDVTAPNSPVCYVASAALISAGFFLIWFNVYFLLGSTRFKTCMAAGVFSLSCVFVVNYLLFNRNQGRLSEMLKYENTPTYTAFGHFIKLAALICLIILCIIIYVRNQKAVIALLLAALVTSGMFSVKNLYVIRRDYTETVEKISMSGDMPMLFFSRKGKNIVVLMIDSLVSFHIPFMITEKPELREMFDGFTFYPNTVSFGCQTIFGSPGLYGGYEYTPKEMNLRDRELNVDKQNEALKVMPVIFDNDGFDVTVCDPTYAGYNDVPDLSIYDDYPGIRSYITMGRFGQNDLTRKRIDEIRNHNFFAYSVFKVSPSILQPVLYDSGNYCSTENKRDDTGGFLIAEGQVTEGLSMAEGVDHSFLKQFYVLDSLSDITEIRDDDRNCFTMMSNSLPHNPMILSEPEYRPAYEVDNSDYDSEHHLKSREDGEEKDFYDEIHYPRYQSNMSSMLLLGKWLEHLKKCGVYDNTRIIIVSDHSSRQGDLAGMVKHFGFEVDRNIPDRMDEADFSIFNCSLLVKDFNAKGFHTDNAFMTNADVPTLAFQDVIDDPVNPFTGKPVDSSYKYLSPLELFMGVNYSVYTNNGYTFQPDHWFSVKDDIFDLDNWEYLGFH